MLLHCVCKYNQTNITRQAVMYRQYNSLEPVVIDGHQKFDVSHVARGIHADVLRQVSYAVVQQQATNRTKNSLSPHHLAYIQSLKIGLRSTQQDRLL